ncbi:MAG: ANTAR domain-containing protein [Acidimicrobiia bacterium]
MAEGDEALFEKLHSVLDLRDERIAALVAEVDGLHAAMEHRGVIEQAKGIIMAAMQCTPDAAFAVLVAQSQHQNRNVREIAAALVALQDG